MNERKIISTGRAPGAIGPYSQAVEAGGFLFASGQIALDPATGAMVGADVATQTERVMENLASILEAAGCGFGDVVKTTIYLADMADFQEVNRIYGSRFEADPPARATVQAAGLPKGALVEIDLVAVRRG